MLLTLTPTTNDPRGRSLEKSFAACITSEYAACAVVASIYYQYIINMHVSYATIRLNVGLRSSELAVVRRARQTRLVGDAYALQTPKLRRCCAKQIGLCRKQTSCSAFASWAQCPAPVADRLHFAVLAAAAAAAGHLEGHTAWGSKAGAPLLAMLLGLGASSVGLLPTWCSAYDTIWSRLLPVAVALLLLNGDLQTGGWRRKEGQMLLACLLIFTFIPSIA